MRIEHILFERATRIQPIVAYHTTFAKHLKSILKHGLIPNKSEGGYGSGETSSTGYNIDALPGTYFYTPYIKAKSLAQDLNRNGETVIVICQIQPKTASMDEDRLVGNIFDENKFAARVRLAKGQGLEELYHDGVEQFMHNIEERGVDPRAISNMKPDVENYVKGLITFIQNKNPENESVIKKHLNTLTMKLRHLVSKEPNKQYSFKVTEPISFSGANKIIGLYLPSKQVGWGELGEFERDAYHKYDSPMQLLQTKSE